MDGTRKPEIWYWGFARSLVIIIERLPCYAINTSKHGDDNHSQEDAERFAIYFHFSDYLKEHFPELDQQIYQKIEDWKQQHYGHQLPDHVLHLYGLVSPWFEEG